MKTIFLLALLFPVSMVFSQNHPDDIIGTWIIGESKARIQVYRSGSKYHGKIIWLKEPTKNGRPKVDSKNPDPSQRTNPVIGLVVLRNFIYDDGHWISGEIYDPSSGKEYSCKISMPNKNTMKVRGYIGISLLGRTEVWKRA